MYHNNRNNPAQYTTRRSCILIFLALCAFPYGARPRAISTALRLTHPARPYSAQGFVGLRRLASSSSPARPVVAMPIGDLRKLLINTHGHIMKTLFSPKGNIQAVNLGLISMESKAIQLAMFAFTNRHLAQALIAAHKRGVKVELVVCRSGSNNRWSKVEDIVASGIPTYVYPAVYTSSIMHHKFAIFSSNFDGRTIVVTGSYNWTVAAEGLNQEDCSYFDNLNFVAPYQEHFVDLKKLSVLVTKPQALRDILSQQPPCNSLPTRLAAQESLLPEPVAAS